MSWVILDDNLSLLILNLAVTGLLISLWGLVLGRILKNSSVPTQHGLMLATLLSHWSFPV